MVWLLFFGCFALTRPWPCLAFPAEVSDCEGASRFPWASSPVTGSYTRATGLLGRLSGWPSAVFAFVPPFAAEPRWRGECQGWGTSPTRSAAEGAGLDAREPLHRILRSLSKEGGKPQRASRRPSNPALRRARIPLGRKPRAALRRRHGPGRVAQP